MSTGGPTLKPFDFPQEYLDRERVARMVTRKYQEYIHFPVYDEKSAALIGFVPQFDRFFETFLDNQLIIPCIYPDPFNTYNTDRTANAFTKDGRMLYAGEGYIGEATFSDGVPWVTKTGDSLGVAFDVDKWNDDGNPVQSNFTAEITAIESGVVTITIGSQTFQTTPGNSIGYNLFFTLTVSSSPTVGHKVDVTLYPTITSAQTPSGPLYGALGTDFVEFTPSYVSGPTLFKVRPGINVVLTSDIGLVFEDTDSNQRNFPSTSFWTYYNGSQLAKFIPTRSMNSYYVNLLHKLFLGTYYPSLDFNLGRYGYLAWWSAADLNKFEKKKFKDIFQSQYSKRYLDISFADIKASTIFNDAQAMALQFPKYDEGGTLLNNPIFDHTGKQIGGATLAKVEPWYITDFIQNRNFLYGLFDQEVKVIDLSLSLLKGEMVASDNPEKLTVAPERLTAIGYHSDNTSVGSYSEVFSWFPARNKLPALVGGVIYNVSGPAASERPANTPTKISFDISHVCKTFTPSYTVNYLKNSGDSFDPEDGILDAVVGTPANNSGDSGTNYWAQHGQSMSCYVLLKSDGLYTLVPGSSTTKRQNYPQQAVRIWGGNWGDISYTYGTVESLGYWNYAGSQLATFSLNKILDLPGTSKSIIRYNGSDRLYVLTSTHLVVVRLYGDQRIFDWSSASAIWFAGYTNAEILRSVPLPSELTSANIVRVLDKSPLMSERQPIALYTNEIKPFSMYYKTDSIQMDCHAHLQITPIQSKILSRRDPADDQQDQNYYLKHTKILRSTKLLANETELNSNYLMSVGICKDFNSESADDGKIYRCTWPEDTDEQDTGVRLQEVDYYNQTERHRDNVILGDNYVPVLSTYVFNPSYVKIYFATGDEYVSPAFEDGQVWWDSPNMYHLYSDWRCQGYYLYVYRNGEFVKHDGENYAAYTVYNMYWVQGFLYSAFGTPASFLQAGDKLYLFKEPTDAPTVESAGTIQTYIRSMCDDGTYLYCLYMRRWRDDKVRLAKINKEKLFNGDADYVETDVEVHGYASNDNMWKGDWSSLIYNESKDCLFINIYNYTNSNYRDLIRINKDSLAKVWLFTTMWPSPYDGDVFMVPILSTLDTDNIEYGKLRVNASTGAYVDEDACVLYVSPLEAINNNGYQIEGLLLGYSAPDFEAHIHGESITANGIKDIAINSPDHDVYFYISTKKSGSSIYNYYKIIPGWPGRSGLNRKAYVEWVKSAETGTAWPEGLSTYPYTFSEAGKILTIDTQYYPTSPPRIGDQMTVDLTFLEDDFQSMSQIVNNARPYLGTIDIGSYFTHLNTSGWPNDKGNGYYTNNAIATIRFHESLHDTNNSSAVFYGYKAGSEQYYKESISTSITYNHTANSYMAKSISFSFDYNPSTEKVIMEVTVVVSRATKGFAPFSWSGETLSTTVTEYQKTVKKAIQPYYVHWKIEVSSIIEAQGAGGYYFSRVS